MPADWRIFVPRLLVFSFILAAICALVFHFGLRTPPVPPDPASAPWIALPTSGMDATEQPIRAVMSWLLGNNKASSSLAVDCGARHSTLGMRDRYIAHVGRSAFDPAWRIELDIHGDEIEIRWSMGGLTAAPPPPPPNPDASNPTVDRAVLITPIATTRKSRADLETVRMRWTEPKLWDHPQDDRSLHCLDGLPVLLEACVRGRYAARMRNCDADGMRASVMLWEAFQEVLPPPPPTWLRDADGRRVQSN